MKPTDATEGSSRVLVVEPSGVGTITLDLEEGLLGSDCSRVTTQDEAQEILDSQDIDLVLVDLQFAGARRLGLIERLHEMAPELPIVVLSDRHDPELEPAVLRAGAEDLLWKGRQVQTELQKTVRRARCTHRKEQRLGAVSDGLTGLANRARLMHRLTALLDRQTQAALLFIDLDGFKPVNDTMGHEVGDQVLVQVARLLEEAVRKTETVARWGGDEFVVLLEGAGAHLGARRVANQIVEGMESLSLALKLSLGASIGIAESLPGETPDELVHRADQAMYRAKRRGGRRVVEADQERSQDSLRFRPRDTVAGSPVCEVFAAGQESTQDLEVLMGRSAVGVDDCGILEAYEALVCGEVALDGALALRLSGLPEETDQVIKELENRIQETKVSPDRLEVVVDASLLAKEPNRARKLFYELERLGIGRVLRAFGGAAAVLQAATGFPWSAVELDVAVVRDLSAGGPRAVVVQGLVQMAQALGFEVRATGVESAPDAAALRAVGVTQILGVPQEGARPAQELPTRWAKAS